MNAVSSIFSRRRLSGRAKSPFKKSARQAMQRLRGRFVTESLEPRLLFTSVSGQTINTAVTWIAADSPYNLNGAVTVGPAGSLTIQSGVTVTGSSLIVASGGNISASDAHFSCPLTLQMGSSGLISSSSLDGSTEFDNTGVVLSDDAFSTNPSVYPTYIPTVVGNGNTFVTGTVIDFLNATLTTPLTLPVVPNVSQYNMSSNGGDTVGTGGALTVDSGVTLTGLALTVASGGSISADNVHFSCTLTMQTGSTGSISSSFINGHTEFDNTGVALSGDAFSTDPSVYPTYVPTVVGNGNTFVTGTVVYLLNATLTTPLTLPVVPNVSQYNVTNNGGDAVGSGGALTIDSGVTLTGAALSVSTGGEISADGATFDCPLNIDGASTVLVANSDLSATSVTAQGSGGPILLANNWWGTTVTSSIDAKITDQNDDASRPVVTYLPILSAKPSLQGVGSTISLGASTNSANLGDSVTFTATLSGTAGVAPTGAVNFILNGVYLGSTVVQGGVAALTTTALPAGSNQVTAVYGGDVNYSGNNSLPDTVDVGGGGGGGGGEGTAGLTPSIVKATVPTALVSGSPLRGSVTVTVTNGTSTTNTGSNDIGIYASGDGTVDSSSILVGQIKESLPLKSGASRTYVVPVSSSSVPTGNYTILAQATDASADVLVSPAGPTLTVAAPFLAFSETVTTINLPASVVSGTASHAMAKVVIKNDGNANSRGAIAISLSASSTSDVPGTLINTISPSPAIRANGGTVTELVPFKSLPDLANNQYYITASVTDPMGGSTIASTTGTTTIAAPFISLVLAFGSIPKAVLTVGAPLIITNNGNVEDGSTFTATIGFSTDGAGADIVGTNAGTLAPARVTVRAGKTTGIHVTGWSALFKSLVSTGPYFLTVTLTDANGNSASAVSSGEV